MAPEPYLIYAELLSNIRQISVLAALETPCDTSTKAKLSDDGQQFILLHNGIRQTLQLPGKSLSTFQLQKPSLGFKELSWRLPWAAQTTNVARYDSHASEVPWSAKYMNTQTELTCRICNETILERGSIKTWKDLPSEDWAEMMDFWHCHKPDKHIENNESSDGADNLIPSDTVVSKNTLVERAYGANSRFSAQPGIGLIDITTFLLAKEDCSKIRIHKSDPTSIEHQPVNCLQCWAELGYYDPDFLGIKFFKWRLQYTNSSNSRSTSSGSPPNSFKWLSSNSTNNPEPKLSAPIFIISKILSKMDSHLVSKFLLTSTSVPEYPTNLLLWIFGTSIRFSSSRFNATNVSKSSTCGLPAVKVFWKEISRKDASTFRDSVGIEEISVPSYVISEMEVALTKSSLLLPACYREYQEWNVGILERYEE